METTLNRRCLTRYLKKYCSAVRSLSAARHCFVKVIEQVGLLP